MHLPKHLIVAGICTEIGKTVASAVLAELLGADYWKPVQAGELELTDTHKIQQWTRQEIHCHPEAYRLQHPMSPHAAAALEGIKLHPERFELPSTDNRLLIELAGGLMVPLTHSFLNIDLVQQLGCPVLLVSRHYLGSINHTLLSVALLKQRGIPIVGILFNGPATPSSKEVILEYTQLPCIGELPSLETISKESILEASRHLASQPFFRKVR